LNAAICPGAKVVCLNNCEMMSQSLVHWDENFMETIRKRWLGGRFLSDTGLGMVLGDDSYSIFECEGTPHVDANRNSHPALKKLNIFGPAFLGPCLFERFQDAVHEHMCEPGSTYMHKDTIFQFLENARCFLGITQDHFERALALVPL